MIFKKEDLNKFDVIKTTDNNVTITDGLLTHIVDINIDDIFDLLAPRMPDYDDVLGNYELLISIRYDRYKNDIIKEYLTNNKKEFTKLKNTVEDFYDDIKDFNFNNFDKWCENWCDYWVGLDVNDKGDTVFSLDYDNDAVCTFQIDKDMYNFDGNIETLKDEIKDLQYLQYDLSVKADEYRENLLTYLNDNLNDYNLTNIPIKKYNNETEIVDTIKEINSDKQEDVEQFLNDYNGYNNHILSDSTGDICIDLVRDKDNGYYTIDDYHGDGDVIDTIRVNIHDILTTDDILYQLDLKDCKKIKENFEYKDRKLEKAWSR